MLVLKDPVGGPSLGQCVYMPDSKGPLLNIGEQTFLKAGNLLVGEEANYPMAYSQFISELPADGYHWITLDNNFTGSALEVILKVGDLYVGFNRGVGLGNPGYLVKSLDCITWETVIVPGLNNLIYGLAFFANRYIIATNDDYAATPALTRHFWSSPDLVTWTPWVDNNINCPYCMASNTSIVVALGAYNADYNTANLYYSTNGTSWSKTGPTTLRGQFYDIKVANNTFFAVGTNVSGVYMGVYSTNGTTWTALGTSLTSLISASFGLTSIAYGAGVYVAVIGNKLYSGSGPTGTFTLRYDAANFPGSDGAGYGLSSVTFDGTRFMAALSMGILYSTNGIDWTVGSDAGYVKQGTVTLPTGQNLSDPILVSVGKTTKLAPVKYLGIRQYLEQDGSPMYMRIK